MNYKLIGDNDYIFDPQGTILRNRGIEDIERFMSITEKDTHSYKLLKNIDRAVKCLTAHIDKKNNILIVVDPDVDGYTSAAILYMYIKIIDNGANVFYALHNDKTHGLKNIEIENDINLVITPDSGSNDFEYHKQLKDRNIDVLVIDHHEIDYESKDAIIINTQLGKYPNHQLSGAGVVYKFCKALDEYYWQFEAEQFLDLVALGNIADSMSMREHETQYYVQKGLQNIKNEFFKALIRKQDYSLKGKLNITEVAFYISPLINAVVRVGEMQDKVDMFKSFIETKELVDYKPRGKKETIKVTLFDDMARRCTNLRAKQLRITNKLMEELEGKIVEGNSLSDKLIFIHDVEMDGGLTGYVANKLASKYKMPAILLRSTNEDDLLKGSARGYDRGELKDFRAIVETSNLFEWAKGHPNAYGAAIKKENIDKVKPHINELLSGYSFEDYYIIDFKIDSTSLTKNLILDICELEYLWGKDIDEPYILIENINTNKVDINLMGKNEDTISIYQDDIKYILFKSNKDFYEELIGSSSFNIIGRPSVNEYKGDLFAQIDIEEIKIIN